MDPAGREREAVLNGVPLSELRKAMQSRPTASPPAASTPLGFRVLESATADIDFAAMSGDRKRFQRDLLEVLGMASDGIRTLIVDCDTTVVAIRDGVRTCRRTESCAARLRR